jgi:hypothetical protein
LGWRLLRTGRPWEAGDAFGRALLRKPDLAEARRGAVRARQALAEEQRVAETRAAEGRVATEVRRRGPQSQRKRAASRRSTPVSRTRTRVAQAARQLDPIVWRRRAAGWLRPLLFGGSALALALALGVLGVRWNSLIARLLQPPVPAHRIDTSAAGTAADSPGRLMLSEARRSLERGDRAAALQLLHTIGQEDPVYPFAERLRRQLLDGGL